MAIVIASTTQATSARLQVVSLEVLDSLCKHFTVLLHQLPLEVEAILLCAVKALEYQSYLHEISAWERRFLLTQV